MSPTTAGAIIRCDVTGILDGYSAVLRTAPVFTVDPATSLCEFGKRKNVMKKKVSSGSRVPC